MFNVKTPAEVLDIIQEEFAQIKETETVCLQEALGRVLAEDITASEYVPDFNRSTVDGYAVSAADTFGCSESIPALLGCTGEMLMGGGYRPFGGACCDSNQCILHRGECVYVPTGGKVPEGADAVAMIEYSEKYTSPSDGVMEIGITKSVAPGSGMIFRGDDVKPGDKVLTCGRVIRAQDIGTLAALGKAQIRVSVKPRVGIISTGDELVDIGDSPAGSTVRDVNSYLLSAICRQAGADTISYGIVRDEAALLKAAYSKALSECDMVILSGGSSVGIRDMTAEIVEESGRLLVHGVAMKPGKPLILGTAGGRPVFGLPGHPSAAFFTAQIFVRAAVSRLLGAEIKQYPTDAILEENISANNGRELYCGVTVCGEEKNILRVRPVHSKSGLISSLAETDGYICVARDCEGIKKGEAVKVYFI